MRHVRALTDTGSLYNPHIYSWCALCHRRWRFWFRWTECRP